MPNYSSSSVNTVDWAMGVDGCHPLKTRNLLDDVQILPASASPTPTPPPFEDFITLTNTRKRTHASLSVSSDGSISLPHQTLSPLLDHTNYHYEKIRARPLYNFKYTEASIWTQSPANYKGSFSNNYLIEVNVVNKYFAKEPKQLNHRERHFPTSSIASFGIRPFRIIEKSLQMSCDITMRHLLQLLAKTDGQNATLDDVLHGIDTGNIDSEWLQCVQRLNKTLNKQFAKRPEDKMKFETYPIENLDQLNTVEQFFLKLLHLPNYNLKLKSYQFRDEFQPQLVFLSQTIDRLLHGIESVRYHQYLPGICQLLCFLYNSVSNKSVPGLDFLSLVDALNSPSNQSKKTVAHVLAEILDQYDRNSLVHTIENEIFIELKKLLGIKYENFYLEIQEIYQQYQELYYEYSFVKDHYPLPLFLQSMFYESKRLFDKLFQQENLLKKGEEDLAIYFCSNDLSLDLCLAMVGQFVDKLRLAHVENSKRQVSFIDYRRPVSLLINSVSPFFSCN